MRVAILVPGIWREYEVGAPSLIKNIIEPLGENCDVFIDTWSAYKNHYNEITTKEYNDFSTWSPLSYDFVTNIPRLKVLNVEDPFVIPALNEGQKSARNLMNQFRKIENNFLMVEKYISDRDLGEEHEKIKYDFVIKTRIDIEYTKSLDLDMLSSIEEGKIFYPNSYAFHGFNDQWFCGRFSTMMKACKVFREIENLYKSGTWFHPETMLREHIIKCGLQISNSDICVYHLLRDGKQRV